MRSLTLACVAALLFGWSAACHAQWFGDTPPQFDGSEIERLPSLDSLPPAAPEELPLLPNPTPQPAPDAEPEAVETPAEEIITEEIVKSPWCGSLELGLSGSDGNNDIFNLRSGFDLKRKTDWSTFTFDLDYKNDSTDNVQTANRLFIEERWEWSPQQNRWSWYAHGTTEYDEFKDFNSRIAGDAGLTYDFIKTEAGRFAGRFGLGTSREFGGSNDDWIPEGSFGLDLERQISKLQSLEMSIDYFPDLTDFGDCRIQTKFDYQIVIDAEMNLALKLGLLDNYDSTPGDALHNDLDYTAALLWKF
jgi:putative salt-induced outer membrane protein YdiY